MSNNGVRFCWLCGNKLYGNHRALLVVDEHPRTFHKQCAKKLKENGRKIDGKYYTNMWDLNGTRKY